MKKIAVVGTHGVGKTTLCNAIVKRAREEGKSVELIGEVVRECPYPINEDMTFEACQWIVLTQILREMEAEKKKPDLIVCDRSAYDPCIYFDYLRKINRSKYDQDRLDNLRYSTNSYLKTYSNILFVRPSGKLIEKDGFRMSDPKMQCEIDMEFEIFIRCFSRDFDYRYIFMLNSQPIFDSIDSIKDIYKCLYSPGS